MCLECEIVRFTLCIALGSLVKKARKKGVKIETLKMPAVTDFALGRQMHDTHSIV